MRVGGWDSGNFSVEPDPHQSCNERWAVYAFLTDSPPGENDRQRLNTLWSPCFQSPSVKNRVWIHFSTWIDSNGEWAIQTGYLNHRVGG